MINPRELEKIKKVTKEFFEKTTFDVEVNVGRPNDNTIPIKVKTEQPRVLIGEKGKVLAHIQRLLKAMLRSSIPKNFYINLDINGYKEKKTQYLKELANSMADEVALMREEKRLPPMPAYERRIIHLELAERSHVTTESVGREPNRRIVIKPYP